MRIDIIFSGGGVKAFAFAGAIEVLEQSGFQFKRAAGTSAGAIVAAMLASGYSAADMKKMIQTMNPGQLLDPPASLRFPFYKWLRVYFKMGLYSGDALEEWLVRRLESKGVRIFADLPSGALKVVAADLSKGRMVVFPDDLKGYGIDPGSFSVARAVRMSAGLPFFFEPVALYHGSGEKSMIVDGGILSNFPLWLFDRGDELPERPFIGLQIMDREAEGRIRKMNRATDLFRGLFTAMRDAHDERLITRLKPSNIISIPVEQTGTTDFMIHESERAKLYRIGAEEARRFLKKWTY